MNFFKDALLNKGQVYSADMSNTAPGLYQSDRGMISFLKLTMGSMFKPFFTCSRNMISP